jgi:twinkle protein
VWEKYLARSAVRTSVDLVSQIYEWNGLSEALWGQVGRRWEEWQAKTTRHTGLPPKELVPPAECAERLYKLVFHIADEQPGRSLPFELGDFRVRESELTVLAGDSETGKSTWLSEVCLHLAQQGGKVVVASMEMPMHKTVWLMCRQLLGVKEIPDSDAGRKQLAGALAWVNERFLLWNFLGITDWRGLLDAFGYAREKAGFDTFVIDNLGMIGIAEDDLDQQGAAAAQFATFAHRHPVHVFGVHHVTKGEGNFKQRVRGSKRWTDFADNALEWMRNEKKGDQLAEAWALKTTGQISEEAWAEKTRELHRQWDAKCVLRKQRWGERKNASRYLWFDPPSRQFRAEFTDTAVKWLERWKKQNAEGNGDEPSPPRNG